MQSIFDRFLVSKSTKFDLPLTLIKKYLDFWLKFAQVGKEQQKSAGFLQTIIPFVFEVFPLF